MFLPKPTAYGLVIAIDEQGRIVRSLHDTSGHHLRMITSAKPVGDQLYFGSLKTTGSAVWRSPEKPSVSVLK